MKAEKIDTGLISSYRNITGQSELENLAYSIKEKGLIHPIVVVRRSEAEKIFSSYPSFFKDNTNPEKEYILLSGYRRFLAMTQILGMEEIPDDWITVKDYHGTTGSFLLEIVRDANLFKDMAPSEKTRLAMQIEEVIREERKQKKLQQKKNQLQLQPQQSSEEDSGVQLSCEPIDGYVDRYAEEPDKHAEKEATHSEQSAKVPSTRKEAAASVGWAETTYERAKHILKAAEKDPETFGDLVEKMDTQGVFPTYREYQQRLKEHSVKKKDERMCPELRELVESSQRKIPDFLLEALVCLTPENQKKIVEKHGNTLFKVKYVDFNRTMNSWSNKAGWKTMPEKRLFNALKDLLESTEREQKIWPFTDPLSALTQIGKNTLRSDFPEIDKAEFFALAGIVFFKFLLITLNQLESSGEIHLLDEEEKKVFAENLKFMASLIESRVLSKLAVAVKEEKGFGTLKDFSKEGEHRVGMNLAVAVSALEEEIPEMKRIISALETVESAQM